MRALMCLCLLLLAAPSWAEFSDIEKAEAKKLFLASVDLREAMTYTVSGAQETTTANQPHVNSAMSKFVFAQRALDEATGLLLWADIDGTAGTWELKTRQEFIAGAFSRLDAVILKLNEVKAALQSAEDATINVARKDDFRRARDIHRVSALVKLNGFDRALAYTDPRSSDYPQIIGPHGHYDRAQNAMMQGLMFLNDAEGHARLLYASTPFWPNYVWYSRVDLRTKETGKKMRRALFHWALIPVDGADCARNKFHLVAFSPLPLLSHTSESGFDGIAGLPYHNNQLLEDSLLDLLNRILAVPAQTGNVLNFIKRWNLFWRFSDGAAKVLMEFPDPAKLDGVGNTGAPSSPFGPPLCPA